jgi:hypothetical protein
VSSQLTVLSFVTDSICFRYLALSQDEEILIHPDMEAAAGL